jgi:hypothetical protein
MIETIKYHLKFLLILPISYLRLLGGSNLLVGNSFVPGVALYMASDYGGEV